LKYSTPTDFDAMLTRSLPPPNADLSPPNQELVTDADFVPENLDPTFKSEMTF
jgi:hypothetical protein